MIRIHKKYKIQVPVWFCTRNLETGKNNINNFTSPVLRRKMLEVTQPDPWESICHVSYTCPESSKHMLCLKKKKSHHDTKVTKTVWNTSAFSDLTITATHKHNTLQTKLDSIPNKLKFTFVCARVQFGDFFVWFRERSGVFVRVALTRAPKGKCRLEIKFRPVIYLKRMFSPQWLSLRLASRSGR